MTIEYFFAALILACIGAYFAWRNNLKVRLAAAHAEFRAAFADAVLNLAESDIPSAQVVHAFRVQHLAAIQGFHRYVPWLKRSGFDKATETYRQCCGKCLEGGIFALAASESTDYAKTNREKLLKSIHDLLRYAKEP